MSSAPGLDRAAVERFRDQLHALKSDAAAAVDTRLHGQGEERKDEAGLPRHADETDDDGAAETQRQADVAHLARKATQLDEIDAALARIDAGDYGLCTDCDETIDLRRLEAYPAALRCARCQQQAELHQARLGRRA
jgi:DnaK suppressor protein